MEDGERIEAIRRIDWTGLRHNFGDAEDMPELWACFLRGEDTESTMFHAICYIGQDLSEVAPLMAPALIELASSEHPRHGDALAVLACVLDMSDLGPRREQRNLHERSPIRNPFSGEEMHYDAPEPEAIHEEEERMQRMQIEIESNLDSWIAASRGEDASVRLSALILLAAVRHHERKEEMHALARAALPSLMEAEQDMVEGALKRSALFAERRHEGR